LDSEILWQFEVVIDLDEITEQPVLLSNSGIRNIDL
jgi:hypothetical protein